MKSEEIARLAGVSRSTVSRVINNYPNVPEKTRKRVMKIIKQYQYEPNTSARVLAGKSTNTIGLFLFSIFDSKSNNRLYGNSYFAPFVDALVDIGNYLGYYMLVHTIYTPDECWKIQQTFSQKRIDGGIIIGTEKNKELESILSQLSYPLTLVDYDPSVVKNAMSPEGKVTVINTDDEAGINACVDHLVSLGHERIGFIKGRDTTFSGLRRFEQFMKRMADHNLTVEDNFVIKGDFTGKTTITAVEKLIKSKSLPTAIISSNDEMALAAVETLQKRGIRVPEDVSVIGYDDAPVSAMVKPSLSSVRVPFYDMAKKAVESLVSCIDNDDGGFTHFNIDVDLILRESCK